MVSTPLPVIKKEVSLPHHSVKDKIRTIIMATLSAMLVCWYANVGVVYGGHSSLGTVVIHAFLIITYLNYFDMLIDLS